MNESRSHDLADQRLINCLKEVHLCVQEEEEEEEEEEFMGVCMCVSLLLEPSGTMRS